MRKMTIFTVVLSLVWCCIAQSAYADEIQPTESVEAPLEANYPSTQRAMQRAIQQTTPQKNSRDSQLPLQQGLDALKQGRWQEADRWLEITANDFPKQLDGLRAVGLQLLYRLAQELAQVRVAHHLLEGSKMELRGQDRQRWLTIMDLYERQGLRWGDEIYLKAEKFITQDQGAPVTLEFAINTQQAAVTKLRQRLIKGELLGEDELKTLADGEWLNNFLGLLGDVLQIPENKILEGNYQAILDRRAFYRAVGVRLFILWQRNHEQKYAQLAKKYFEKVMELTASEPYQVDRQKASDFLGRLNQAQPVDTRVKRGASKKSGK